MTDGFEWLAKIIASGQIDTFDDTPLLERMLAVVRAADGQVAWLDDFDQGSFVHEDLRSALAALREAGKVKP